MCVCAGRRVDVSGTCLKFIHVAFAAQVIFEKEEVDSLKSFAEPGLLLLGFKAKERLKPHYYTKPANFIYPDESVSVLYLIRTVETIQSTYHLHVDSIAHYLLS